MYSVRHIVCIGCDNQSLVAADLISFLMFVLPVGFFDDRCLSRYISLYLCISFWMAVERACSAMKAACWAELLN